MDLPRLKRRMRRGQQPKEAQSITATVSYSHREILTAIAPYTMTSPERQVALIDAVDHVVARGIPGAMVECGVWRGGSALAMVMRLQQLGVNDRPVYLYDTYEGMTEPTDLDVSDFDEPALDTWENAPGRPWEQLFDGQNFNLEAVREVVGSTAYPTDLLHFVVGDVLETLPTQAPASVALLRLDTDWYESTRHELEHLYPRLSRSGVLIVDDYGHWQGSRQAVDEYFSSDVPRPLLLGVDYTCRVGVKAD